MTILWLLAGVVPPAGGGDVLGRGAVGAAARPGISPMRVSLSNVGFGTSTPELVTSVLAALHGAPGIAVGNVVGSNVANILLILGVTAVMLPIAVTPAAFRRDGTALAVATLACLGVALLGQLDRAIGLVLVALLLD